MARDLAAARLSWRGAVALGVLVSLAAASVHVAWGGVAAPVSARWSEVPSGSEVAAILPALYAQKTVAFSPDALVTRPLFSPDRKSRIKVEPVPEPQTFEPPAPPLPPAPPSYLVDGIMVSGEIRKTLLRRRPREPGQWLNQGDTTQEGWTIASIKADGIVLEQGGRAVAMSLRAARRIH